MKLLRQSRMLRMVALLSCALSSRPASLAANQQPPRSGPAFQDVDLGPRGEVRGQIVDAQGQPLRQQELIVWQRGDTVGRATTDEQGRFVVQGVRGGLFQLQFSSLIVPCRGWVQGTAPPAARRELLIVPEELLARGQRPFRDLFLADPILVGLIVTAAVVIPIAVHNSRDGS